MQAVNLLKMASSEPVSLSNVILPVAIFRGPTLQAQTLRMVVSTGVTLRMHLQHALFNGADLTGADFRGANLTGAIFDSANESSEERAIGEDEEPEESIDEPAGEMMSTLTPSLERVTSKLELRNPVRLRAGYWDMIRKMTLDCASLLSSRWWLLVYLYQSPWQSTDYGDFDSSRKPYDPI